MSDSSQTDGQVDVPIRVLDVSPVGQQVEILAYATVKYGPVVLKGLTLVREIEGTVWLKMPWPEGDGGHAKEPCCSLAERDYMRLYDSIMSAYVEEMKRAIDEVHFILTKDRPPRRNDDDAWQGE